MRVLTVATDDRPDGISSVVAERGGGRSSGLSRRRALRDALRSLTHRLGRCVGRRGALWVGVGCWRRGLLVGHRRRWDPRSRLQLNTSHLASKVVGLTLLRTLLLRVGVLRCPLTAVRIVRNLRLNAVHGRQWACLLRGGRRFGWANVRLRLATGLGVVDLLDVA